MSCNCGSRGHFGLDGGRVGGGGGGRDRDEERRRKLAGMEAEKKRTRSVGAKKRTMLRWCNLDESPPLSLRAYAPAWFRRPRLDYAAWEGSSRGSSSASSPPAFPNSGLIYARNDAEEHALWPCARERQEAVELAAAVAKADKDAMDVDIVFLDD